MDTTSQLKFSPISSAISFVSNPPNVYIAAWPDTKSCSFGRLLAAVSSGIAPLWIISPNKSRPSLTSCESISHVDKSSEYAFPPLQMIDSGGSIQWLTIPNVASAPSPPANFFAASATSSHVHSAVGYSTPNSSNMSLLYASTKQFWSRGIPSSFPSGR